MPANEPLNKLPLRLACGYGRHLNVEALTADRPGHNLYRLIAIVAPHAGPDLVRSRKVRRNAPPTLARLPRSLGRLAWNRLTLLEQGSDATMVENGLPIPDEREGVPRGHPFSRSTMGWPLGRGEHRCFLLTPVPECWRPAHGQQDGDWD